MSRLFRGDDLSNHLSQIFVNRSIDPSIREKESLKFVYEALKELGLKSNGRSHLTYENENIISYNSCKRKYESICVHNRHVQSVSVSSSKSLNRPTEQEDDDIKSKRARYESQPAEENADGVLSTKTKTAEASNTRYQGRSSSNINHSGHIHIDRDHVSLSDEIRRDHIAITAKDARNETLRGHAESLQSDHAFHNTLILTRLLGTSDALMHPMYLDPSIRFEGFPPYPIEMNASQAISDGHIYHMEVTGTALSHLNII